MSSEVIYTDGACSGNGKANATGGFGIFIASSKIFKVPAKINCKGASSKFMLNDKEQTFHVTNIRMEGLAIVSTLALYANALIDNISHKSDINPVARLNECEPFKTTGFKEVYGLSELRTASVDNSASIEIITDSLFWINVIESWMPNWIRKGVMMQKKNPDILLMLRYYMELFKQNCIMITYTHVRSHQRGKRTTHADGNDVADVLATSAVKNDSDAFVLA